MAEAEPLQWDSEEFEYTRTAIQNRFGCSELEAMDRLRRLFENPNRTPRNSRSPAPGPPSPSPPPPPPPPPRNQIPPPPEEDEVDEIFTAVGPDAIIPSKVPLTPLKWAVDRLKARKYVQLWYFTAEGIQDAQKSPPIIADETLGINQTDAGFTLHHVKSTKPSHNVVEDENLSWDQIMIARHNLAVAIDSWPKKLRDSLLSFYLNIEAVRSAGSSNTRALILYHATARRLWHNALQGSGKGFNITFINGELLADMENKIRDNDQRVLLETHRDLKDDHELLKNQASKPSSSRTNSNTHPYPPHCLPISFSSRLLLYSTRLYSTPRLTRPTPHPHPTRSRPSR